jgi:hypothetical protein
VKKQAAIRATGGMNAALENLLPINGSFHHCSACRKKLASSSNRENGGNQPFLQFGTLHAKPSA